MSTRVKKEQASTYKVLHNVKRRQNVSNKCKNEEGIRTHNNEIALCSMGSMHSEPQIIAPDGGWGWVIVLASFFLHLISEY